MHSIESITDMQMTKVLNTFLLFLFETKNPKGIKTRMFAIMFLKAKGSVIFLRYGDMLLNGIKFIFLKPSFSFSIMLLCKDMILSKLPSNFKTTKRIKKAI